MPCLSPVPTPDLRHYWPCGRCKACLEKYAADWTQRMLDEYNSCGRIGVMLTLTYDNEHLPPEGNLRKDDFQRFMKRLRKVIAPVKVRYFMCGEYGGKFGRPHFHCVLFGWCPSDLRRVGYKDYFKSRFIESVWQQGFVSVIVDLNEKTLKYNAKYLNKLKSNWKDVAPFTTMSRRPGLGASVVSPEMLLTGMRYVNGRPMPVPRFYLDKLDQQGYNTQLLRKARSAYLADSRAEGNTPEIAAQKRYSDALMRSGIVRPPSI